MSLAPDSILHLSRSERAARFGDEATFISALTRNDMIMIMCDPLLFKECCCVSRHGITTGQAAALILDEAARRGITFGSEPIGGENE